MHVAQEDAYKALALAGTLDDVARAAHVIAESSWAAPLWKSSIAGESQPVVPDAPRPAARTRRDRRRAGDAAQAFGRSASGRVGQRRRQGGDRPRRVRAEDVAPSLGRQRDAKALVSAIRLDGSPLKDGDAKGGSTSPPFSPTRCAKGKLTPAGTLSREASAYRMAASGARRSSSAEACWRPATPPGLSRNCCRRLLRRRSTWRRSRTTPRSAPRSRRRSGPRPPPHASRPSTRSGGGSARCSRKGDRTSALVLQLLDEVIGSGDVQAGKVSGLWRGVLRRLEDLKARARDFEEVEFFAAKLSAAGAPAWAKRVISEKSGPTGIPCCPRTGATPGTTRRQMPTFRESIRELRLAKLATDREAADRQVRKLFGELVRERTFYELDRRLSPLVKSALVTFVPRSTKIPKGKDAKSAPANRRAAREAMAQCYDAVPCWIMPTWRVAEQLPPEIGALELVIIDEASQSDVTELPALLRGKKIIVVGDDRQVSPTAPFVTQEKITQLRHHYLGDLPFNTLLEPGESIYDLMRAVFPERAADAEGAFPLRRADHPLLHGVLSRKDVAAADSGGQRAVRSAAGGHLPAARSRARHRKVNEAEADVIVKEIASLTARSDMQKRTIGVISLIGAEQADLIRAKLSQAVGEEVMQRHAILCGDSATFQGTERDIVFLSMVADPMHKSALTMLRYEQRFNVAVSRARDRVVLVRSVKREDLNPSDLKARLIAHFENPMPEVKITADALDACESVFERDVMSQLLERGYRVQAQVGSLGYRIDMVAEGASGARLAIECDGDRYHGPEQWRQDMNRQRVLERVGWRFWRCFASSFYRDTEAVVKDLLDTLSRMGIEPAAKDDGARGRRATPSIEWSRRSRRRPRRSSRGRGVRPA